MQRLAKIWLGVALGYREAIWPAVNIEEGRIINIRLLQLDGARSRGSATRGAFAIGNHRGEGFRYARHIRYGIQKDLCVKRTREGMRVIDQVFLVRRIRAAGLLVR